jgi:hypothetical protein
MEEAQFESSPDLPKNLLVFAWGLLTNIFIFTHLQMEHQERPDQQRKDQSAPARWNQSGQERSAPLKMLPHLQHHRHLTPSG